LIRQILVGHGNSIGTAYLDIFCKVPLGARGNRERYSTASVRHERADSVADARNVHAFIAAGAIDTLKAKRQNANAALLGRKSFALMS
jgi:hypothetical protein